jgi:mannose-6-phosphate isomerase-like protein (cupin superfamily)
LRSKTVLSLVVYSNFSGVEGKVREMKKMEAKSMNRPDEVRSFDKGKVELVKIGGATVGRAIFQPGWKWSESVKPLVKTKSCEAPHFQYHVSGTLRVKMDDGTEVDLKAGDVSLLPNGHDAWVVGNEPAVVVDFQGMIDYAKGKAKK